MKKILADSEIQDSSRKLKILPESVSYSGAEIRDKLLQLEKTCCIVKNGDSVGVCLKAVSYTHLTLPTILLV